MFPAQPDPTPFFARTFAPPRASPGPSKLDPPGSYPPLIPAAPTRKHRLSRKNPQKRKVAAGPDGKSWLTGRAAQSHRAGTRVGKLPGTVNLLQQPRPGMQQPARNRTRLAREMAPERKLEECMATCFYMVRSWHRASRGLGGCRRFVEPVSPRLCIKTIL